MNTQPDNVEQDSIETLPERTVDLVDLLDRAIPEVCPHLNMTDRQIWFYAGQRQVVRLLKSRLQQE